MEYDVSKSGTSARRRTSPYVRSAVAALLFGGVVVVTFWPEVADFLSSPVIILITLMTVGGAVGLWVHTRVELYRTDRVPLEAADGWWQTFSEIERLEEMHELPACVPNRSTYTRRSALS